MTAAQLARNDEERRYYALEDKAWRLLAPVYDALVRPLRRMRGRVARLAEVRPGMRVLDVATGTGEQALAFAEAGADVTGVDLSAAMLRIARRKGSGRTATITFREADARALPFADAAFERAGISFGLHEMPPSVRREALRELARVTKPDGLVVIVDYALPPGRIARWFVYHLVKLYERDSYAEFVRADLQAFTDDAGLVAVNDGRSAVRWWRPVIIVVARKQP